MALECDSALSEPDFTIVRAVEPNYVKAPLELHGFPPWHLRLTEIHHSQYQEQPMTTGRSCMLDEMAFREALDEYAMAEFRFGR